MPSRSPTAAMASALRQSPLPRKETSVSPTSVSAKYSGGPKSSARLESGGARKMSPMSPSVPAMNEPNAEMPSAAPARPRFAISKPSMQVITEADSPGTRSRMDVVEPPYMEPYQM